MKDMPVRKSQRLKGFNYSSKGAYFITFCVKGRHGLLGKVIVGRGIHDAPYVDLSEHGMNLCNAIGFIHQNNDHIKIDEYVIMPNHVHMIVVVNEDAYGASGDDYGAKEDAYGVSGDAYGVSGEAYGANEDAYGAKEDDYGASGKPRPTNAEIPKLISSIKRFTNKQAGFNLWQTSYHDHIIRNEADYQRICQYIDENPAKWQEDRYFTQSIV
jgi:REP element-mobilizing transposase RayT